MNAHIDNTLFMVAIVVKSIDIAEQYEQKIKSIMNSLDRSNPLLIVGIIATNDPWAEQYATCTDRACNNVGIAYKLIRTTKDDIQSIIKDSNDNNNIHGIIVYYPVFDSEQDRLLQQLVSPDKDVEGLSEIFRYNIYHNIRYLDIEKKKKSILPCTALAIVKIFEYLSIYHPLLPKGNKLHGRVIGVINRSETVGRPLASMLANDGAKVFSIDKDTIDLYYRGPGLINSFHQITRLFENTNENIENILSQCDIVITGVPIEFKIPTYQLKDGVVAINFSSFNNFDDGIIRRASIHVPSIGRVTVSMLMRNLLRLYWNKHKE